MQRRTCRACGTSYQYPIPKSMATRFYCEDCVEIPVNTRRVLEAMRRRIDRMATKIEQLESELSSGQKRSESGS